MTRHISNAVGLCLAALSAAALIVDTPLAAAQGAQGSESASQTAPPAGQYAPPPAGGDSIQSNYDDRAQKADRDYADRYSLWAAQYCVDQHNKNTAAGAIIGGVFGAIVGAGVTHNPAAGAIVGGAMGAGTGAAIGASASSNSCPPGYVVRVGAPAFVYAGPYLAPAFAYAPAWYRPWVWSGGHWLYYPYRYWYWFHRGYWRPGWVGRAWRYHYRRW